MAAAGVPQYAPDAGNGLPPTPDDTANDFEESMIGGPETEDLRATAATRRQDGGGHGDDARRGSGLGSDRPMGAAADATAALQQEQQQAASRPVQPRRLE